MPWRPRVDEDKKRRWTGRIAFAAGGAGLLAFARKHAIGKQIGLSHADAVRAEREEAPQDSEPQHDREADSAAAAPATQSRKEKPAPAEDGDNGSGLAHTPRKIGKFKLPGVVRMLIASYNAWNNDQASRRGAALAYYTLFALGPILMVAIAIAGAVFGQQAARGEIVGQVEQLIGPQGAQALQTIIAGAYHTNAGKTSTIIGMVTLSLAAIGAFLELQTGLNVIWRVKQAEHLRTLAMIWNVVLKRLRSIGLLVAVGFLLMVSLIISAGLHALGGWAGRTLTIAPLLLTVASLGVSLLIITLLFAAIYRILPDVNLTWRDVWTGALITAVLFELGKEAIGLYLGHSSTASAYGAAGSLVVLMVWVYYSAQIMLFGAEFSRVYTLARRKKRPTPEPHAQPRSGPK